MTEKKRMVKLTDFLTDAQIRECIQLKYAKQIREKVIAPNIEEINRKLGQENDPSYLAYVCEYVVSQI